MKAQAPRLWLSQMLRPGGELPRIPIPARSDHLLPAILPTRKSSPSCILEREIRWKLFEPKHTKLRTVCKSEITDANHNQWTPPNSCNESTSPASNFKLSTAIPNALE